MKLNYKYYIIGLLVFGMALLGSCKDENELSSAFSVDKEEIAIGENGGVETIQVNGDVKWQTSVNATWVRVLPSNGVGSALCEVKVDSSVVADFRNAEIQFMAEGNATKTIKVVQAGYAKKIYVENADQEILIENTAEFGKRYYDLKMTANTNFTVTIDAGETNWLRYDDEVPSYDYGDRPRTFNQRFSWDTNVQEEERTATVTITPADGEPVVLSFRQKSAPKITDDRAGDSLAILAIYETLNGMLGWDSSENMMYWDGVELWKATDREVQDKPELLGRVKSVQFRLFETYESLPYQVKYLKTARSIYFSGNTNTFLKSITLGDDICELAQYGNLKELTISAYGLNTLPAGFAKLGQTLELLNLSSNNFEYNKLDVLTKENFPKLKVLRLSKINRFDTTKDLQNVTTDTIGFRWTTGYPADRVMPEGVNINNGVFFKNLLRWDTLEELSLSINLLEGHLPSDEELIALGLPRYTEEDITSADYYKNDSITLEHAGKYLLKEGNHAPKVWPRMRIFSVNLSFLSGKLPKWILYHPYLAFWNPFTMIFTQETGAIDSFGNKAGFTNEPNNLSNYSNTTYTEGSYYDVYPNRIPGYVGEETESEN